MYLSGNGILEWENFNNLAALVCAVPIVLENILSYLSSGYLYFFKGIKYQTPFISSHWWATYVKTTLKYGIGMLWASYSFCYRHQSCLYRAQCSLHLFLLESWLGGSMQQKWFVKVSTARIMACMSSSITYDTSLKLVICCQFKLFLRG